MDISIILHRSIVRKMDTVFRIRGLPGNQAICIFLQNSVSRIKRNRSFICNDNETEWLCQNLFAIDLDRSRQAVRCNLQRFISSLNLVAIDLHCLVRSNRFIIFTYPGIQPSQPGMSPKVTFSFICQNLSSNSYFNRNCF